MSKSKSIQDKKYECRVCNSCYPFRYIECPNCKRSGDIWELVEQSKDKRYTEKQNRLTKEDQERLLPKFRNVEQSKEEQCDSDPLGPMIYGTKPKTEDTGECDFDFSKMSPGVQCPRCSLTPCGTNCPYFINLIDSAPLNKDWSDRFDKIFEWCMELSVMSNEGKYTLGGELKELFRELIESARASERKAIVKKIKVITDEKNAVRIADINEKFQGSRDCKMCGQNPERWRIELLSKIEK